MKRVLTVLLNIFPIICMAELDTINCATASLNN